MIWYSKALQKLGEATLDLGAGTFKIALCSSAYTADTSDSGDDFFDDVSGVLASVTLSGVAWSAAREKVRKEIHNYCVSLLKEVE